MHDLIGPQIAQLERQKQEAEAKVDEVKFPSMHWFNFWC